MLLTTGSLYKQLQGIDSLFGVIIFDSKPDGVDMLVLFRSVGKKRPPFNFFSPFMVNVCLGR
jgi:hypothetical protein